MNEPSDRPATPLQFSLRTLLIAMSVLMILAACAGLLERTWFHPRRVGLDAQQRLDAMFAQNGWQGQATAYFYDGRVRIQGADIGDAEVLQLLPILRDIDWLQQVELLNTQVTDQGQAALQLQLPDAEVIQVRTLR